MKRFVIAVFTSMFILGSTATMASGNLESSLTYISAENISNWMSCRDKMPNDSVKSATTVVNGKIPKIKCADVNKIVEDAQASSK